MSHSIRKSIVTSLLTCAATWALFSASASAQTETFLSSSFLKDPGSLTDFTLPSFDTSLGTLDSVDISLKFNLCAVLVVDNTTSSAIAFKNALVDVPLTVNAPGSTAYNTDLLAKLTAGNAHPGVTRYSLVQTSTYGSITIDPASLDLWADQPGSTVTLSVAPSSAIATLTALSSGLDFSGVATEWGDVSVTYTYTSTLATPEPRGMYLTLIVGLAMAGFVLRRRVSAI